MDSWRELRSGSGGKWMAAYAVSAILLFHIVATLLRRLRNKKQQSESGQPQPQPQPQAQPQPPRTSELEFENGPERAELSTLERIRASLSDTHFKILVNELEDNSGEELCWQNVIDKKNGTVSYSAKCCDPKDGSPTKYLSTTIFEGCSTEVLRDFYMDNEFRKEWDKTVLEHSQLEVDSEYGIEIGRTIKKFTLIKPREYVLAWRLWEGGEKSYYCLIKACQHPLAPLTNKYKRVSSYYSGWRIRKVEGRDACEVRLVHQEDAGLQREMTKLAFSKSIWSYVLKMDANLRKFAMRCRLNASKEANVVSQLQKAPLEDDSCAQIQDCEIEVASNNRPEKKGIVRLERKSERREISKSCSKKKVIANGLLLLGGAVCLTRGSSIAAKFAVACLVNKILNKHRNYKNDVQ